MRVDCKGGREGCEGVTGDDGWIVLGFGEFGGSRLPRWEDERVEDGEPFVED